MQIKIRTDGCKQKLINKIAGASGAEASINKNKTSECLADGDFNNEASGTGSVVDVENHGGADWRGKESEREG